MTRWAYPFAVREEDNKEHGVNVESDSAFGSERKVGWLAAGTWATAYTWCVTCRQCWGTGTWTTACTWWCTACRRCWATGAWPTACTWCAACRRCWANSDNVG